MSEKGEGRIGQHPILHPLPEPTVPFTFNDRPFLARKGEVISSALISYGIDVFNHHERDGAPQGIFCANGQCAQCLVLAHGKPVKACITPVKEGMDVRSLDGLPELLEDDEPVQPNNVPECEVDVLVIGGGPAGLSATSELARSGQNILLVDDKQTLGGKLGLQTHNFFGSIRDCNAGMRGMDIGTVLADEVEQLENVDIWLESPVVGLFSDGRVGIVRQGRYFLVRPKHILISTGAREKTLTFQGCDLPGVYGAGAFQTLVNRDLVKASSRLFIVGGGNVGLIAAYHALQAGIEVLGIVEALPQCGGYSVHLDKIKRLGIPVWTSHTVLKAAGDGRVERVTIAEVDETFTPVPGTEQTLEVDTLLVAVGLSPVNELTAKARHFGYSVYEAGDAAVIAEASAAIFSGRIIGRRMLQDLGIDAPIPDEWYETLEMLRSKPGPTHKFKITPLDTLVYPVIRCVQEIPCNPCAAVCPKNSISLSESRMTSLPKFTGECLGCTGCAAICPGLAISIVDKDYDPSGEKAVVILPWEMPDGIVQPGDEVETTAFKGGVIGAGRVLAIKNSAWLNRRRLLLLEVPAADADNVAGIRSYRPTASKPETEHADNADDDDIIVCRCERVTRGEIVGYIRETGVQDFNALKAALRVGMGPCGGKTCTDHVMRIFKQVLGKDAIIEPHLERPFTQEVPLEAFLKGGDGD